MNSTIVSSLPANYMGEAAIIPCRPTISLLIDESSASGRSLLEGVLSYIRKQTNWRLYLPEHQRGSCVPDSVCQYPGVGVIAQIENAEIAEAVSSWGVPAVNVGTTHLFANIPWVSHDDQEIASQAHEHLRGLGFQNLAFFMEEGCSSSEAMFGHFSDCLQRAELACSVYKTQSSDSWEEEYRTIRDWLMSLPRPLGIMAGNCQQGRKLLSVCRAAGIKVPEEVAVLAVSHNSLLCELADPPLTSVVPNSERVGYEAARCLDRLLDGDQNVQLITLVRPKSAVARKSTDCYALDDPDVAAAARFIREHALTGIKVADVLEAVPMSRTVLENKFRSYLGCTPHQLILNVRLEHVKILLEDADLSLERIAARCGFRHVEYLTVVFKRELGQTPSAYRRQFQ